MRIRPKNASKTINGLELTCKITEVEGFLIAAVVPLILCVLTTALAKVFTDVETKQTALLVGGLFTTYLVGGQLVGRAVQHRRLCHVQKDFEDVEAAKDKHV